MHNHNLHLQNNLHSLIPYSMNARKPVFLCNNRDGLRGAHISKALESRLHFSPILDYIEKL